MLIANEILYSIAFPMSDTANNFLDGPGTAFTDEGQARYLRENASEEERRDFLRGLGFVFIDAYFEEFTVPDDAGVSGRRGVEDVPQLLFERAVRVEDRAEDIALLWDLWPAPTEVEAVTRTRELLTTMDPVELVLLCDPQRALVEIDTRLRGRVFAGMELEGIRFDAFDLTGADFAEALLHGASFQDTNLTRVSFAGADISGANFSGADLTAVSFAGANLRGAQLGDARNPEDVSIWSGATCPDGSEANSHGATCEGHL